VIALAVIDIYHSVLRTRYHPGTQQHGWLPGWLSRLIYSYQPHRYDDTSPVSSRHEGFYHSMQRSLMRLEAEEAFALRSVVLGGVGLVLGLGGLGLLWVGWKIMRWTLWGLFWWIEVLTGW